MEKRNLAWRWIDEMHAVAALWRACPGIKQQEIARLLGLRRERVGELLRRWREVWRDGVAAADVETVARLELEADLGRPSVLPSLMAALLRHVAMTKVRPWQARRPIAWHEQRSTGETWREIADWGKRWCMATGRDDRAWRDLRRELLRLAWHANQATYDMLRQRALLGRMGLSKRRRWAAPTRRHRETINYVERMAAAQQCLSELRQVVEEIVLVVRAAEAAGDGGDA